MSSLLRTFSFGVGLTPALSAAATINLFATHYSTQSVHTLALTSTSNGTYSLKETSSLQTCGTYPSWITLDSATGTIYCSDEYGWTNENETVNGSLTTLAVAEDGSLTEEAVTDDAPGSGVHNVVYEGEGGSKYLAVAHYSGSAVSTYALPLTDDAAPLQVFEFTLAEPGANPDRQEAPHPHQALLDPTGTFVLVPDLGADLVRVFSIDKSSGELVSCPPLNYTIGGGPRHGVFWSGPDESAAIRGRRAPGRPSAPGSTLYVAGELNGEVEAFAVSYPSTGCLSFEQIGAEVPYPEDLPEGASLAETRLVGDNLYVSVRRDDAFDGADSLARLSRTEDGSIAFEEISSSGGVLPRTFAINKAGDLVAVGNQLSSNIAIVERDPETGILGGVVADLVVGEPGEPDTLTGLSSIIWAE
ncbi:lactonase family protein [Aspergillus undulatus]|uniref:lactonase family protein n=1 Tax=Aspergillus undulatus TaxID=1810928 RepID=UPI003CCDCF1C